MQFSSVHSKESGEGEDRLLEKKQQPEVASVSEDLR